MVKGEKTFAADSSFTKARRPVSDTEPCEGIGYTSPSNPNQAVKPLSSNELTERLIFRCSIDDKTRIDALAQSSAQTLSEILREALDLAKARRLRPISKADPALLRKVAGIGNNLNQIARHLNREVAGGNIRAIDGVALSAQFIVIERLLVHKIDEDSQ